MTFDHDAGEIDPALALVQDRAIRGGDDTVVNGDDGDPTTIAGDDQSVNVLAANKIKARAGDSSSKACWWSS